MKDFDDALGVALRSLRDRQGMTTVEMVERTGIPGSEIEAYEAGQAIPSASLRAISSALGISLPVFLGHAYPRSTGTATSIATPMEGKVLIEHFLQIPCERSRRFLIDMAHALADHEFNRRG